MDKPEIISRLKELKNKCEIYDKEPFSIDGDPDDWHREADSLLLKFINDEEISDFFFEITRWYS